MILNLEKDATLSYTYDGYDWEHIVVSKKVWDKIKADCLQIFREDKDIQREVYLDIESEIEKEIKEKYNVKERRHLTFNTKMDYNSVSIPTHNYDYDVIVTMKRNGSAIIEIGFPIKAYYFVYNKEIDEETEEVYENEEWVTITLSPEVFYDDFISQYNLLPNIAKGVHITNLTQDLVKEIKEASPEAYAIIEEERQLIKEWLENDK